ncbi:hypothetical protein M885DRAFT_522634 [Pelagophyceae sp. CCMP2097]|nr:hypothetical protein M885DRAFT_522634 [Pelagophyceae sp. CCMP2097]
MLSKRPELRPGGRPAGVAVRCPIGEGRDTISRARTHRHQATFTAKRRPDLLPQIRRRLSEARRAADCAGSAERVWHF